MKRVLAQDRQSGELGVADGHVPAVARQQPEPVVGDVSNWASSASAWERRKSAQVEDVRSGAGSIPACCSISHPVEAATLIPSTRSSPWMRR
jgi:hypothetical protein